MEKVAASYTIDRCADMTPEGRKEIADWLRRAADDLETLGHDYAKKFRGRYIYHGEAH